MTINQKINLRSEHTFCTLLEVVRFRRTLERKVSLTVAQAALNEMFL